MSYAKNKIFHKNHSTRKLSSQKRYNWIIDYKCYIFSPMKITQHYSWVSNATHSKKSQKHNSKTSFNRFQLLFSFPLPDLDTDMELKCIWTITFRIFICLNNISLWPTTINSQLSLTVTTKMQNTEEPKFKI